MINNFSASQLTPFVRKLTSLTGRLLFVALFFLSGYQGVVGQDLIITPANTSVTDPLPANFTLTVEVSESPVAIDAATLRLSFDPAVLQAVSVTPLSGFFPIVPPTIDNTAGSIVYNVGLFFGAPSGSFGLAAVNFQAIAEGNTNVDFVRTGSFPTIIASAGIDVLQNTTGANVVIGTANVPPAISITSPENGDSFVTGDDVTITASASDSDGTVSSVEFFDGTVSLGTDESAPFEVVLTGITSGSHQLTAVATDNEGGEGTSAIVTISANTGLADVALIPSSTSVTGIGTTFTVLVEVQPDDGQPVNGATLNINFDPSLIEVSGFTVPNNPFNLTITGPSENNGTITYDGGSTPPFPTNNFEVFTIEFTTLAFGTANLTFQGVNILAYAGDDITRLSQGTSIVISSPVLPVELISFTGNKVDKRNVLEWTAASEEAFSHYELERSSDDAPEWELLGAVAGAGEVEQAQTYTYSDDGPPNSAYYRLRMVDLDDDFAYSNIVHLKRGTETGELVVYPNPNDGQFVVEVPTEESAVMTLFDLNGKIVWKRKVSTDAGSVIQFGSASDDMSVAKLPSGVYLLSAKTVSNFWTKRIVVR
ncbi:Ig-like domain-containing protein [Neolewinella persica]|uniref:Ig-like domain-containing protein n=1 Tax=Neolewinella persica TaxID=70998 RepID=UPI00037D47AF|nr:Ig-like domain-containing protein [Neolewinella persica]